MEKKALLESLGPNESSNWYTMAEVKAQKDQKWIVINGRVYEVTEFVAK